MANSWLRLWHEMPNDPKWRTISRISNQPIPSVVAVYVHLLVAASQSTPRGTISSVHPEDIASALDIDADAVMSIMSAMNGRVLDRDVVTGWEKRQPAREDSSTERTKNYRLRHIASQTNGDGNSASVTKRVESFSPF